MRRRTKRRIEWLEQQSAHLAQQLEDERARRHAVEIREAAVRGELRGYRSATEGTHIATRAAARAGVPLDIGGIAR